VRRAEALRCFEQTSLRLALGLELETLSRGRAVLAMTAQPTLRNSVGGLHGGSIAALIDATAAAATWTGIGRGDVAITRSLQVVFLSGVRRGRIRAEGRILDRHGHSLSVFIRVCTARGRPVAEGLALSTLRSGPRRRAGSRVVA
jgi:uncharacterized protein (TIGR00369 family)